MFLAPISFGIFQFRVAEALCLLPIFLPQAVYGLTLGCLITNSWGIVMGFNPLGIMDVVLGTLATFIAAILTKKIKKIPYAVIPPIALNMFVIGGELTYIESGKIFSNLFIINSMKIFAEETICVMVLGVPLCKMINNVLQNSKKK